MDSTSGIGWKSTGRMAIGWMLLLIKNHSPHLPTSRPPMANSLNRGAFLLLLCCIASTVVPGEEPSTQPSPLTYSINVGLVVLPVTVLDKSGRVVSGLTEKDFDVYEDGVRQQLEVFDQKDRPVTVGLILDSSGSMVPKRAEVAAAALKLAESSNPEDQTFVVHFHELISFGLPLGVAFTSDIKELQKAIFCIAGSGQTALYDAVVAGLERVQQSDLPKKVLVIMSDGGDNASRHTMEETLDMAVRSNALIYSIGLYNQHEKQINPKVLKRLAVISGGEAYFPNNLSQVSEICQEIATTIRSQYTLGYSPINQKKDGSYRSIRVNIKDAPGRGRLTVRTRSGYLTPEETGLGTKKPRDNKMGEPSEWDR
jgi:Ca-activated chloride channel homolog